MKKKSKKFKVLLNKMLKPWLYIVFYVKLQVTLFAICLQYDSSRNRNYYQLGGGNKNQKYHGKCDGIPRISMILDVALMKEVNWKPSFTHISMTIRVSDGKLWKWITKFATVSIRIKIQLKIITKTPECSWQIRLHSHTFSLNHKHI